MTELLGASGVVVSHRSRSVLDIESLAVVAGERLAVMGPNGSGKSTLLRVLALLQRPDTGAVHWHGQPVRARGRALVALRRRMASVMQAPLLCDASVWDNVAMAPRFRGMRAEALGRRVAHWLERLGIAHLARRNARTLSGGEAQRTSLARAFAAEPDILFLDEPFAALDAPTRDVLLDDLAGLLGESRTTTVFATHEISEALLLADRTAVLLGGRVAQVGPSAQLADEPASEAVARFLGVENLLSGRVTASDGSSATIAVTGGELTALARAAVGSAVTVALRAEDVTLGTVAGHAPNSRRGTITRVIPGAGDTRLEVDVGFRLRVRVLGSRLLAGQLESGAEVMVDFAPAAVRLIRAG